MLQTVEFLDSISAQIVLREAYEVAYRIYNHEDPSQCATQGLELVVHHTKENYGEYGPLHQITAKFRFHEVSKHYGYNLTEFLALPREMIQVIFEDIGNEHRRATIAIDAAIEAAKGNR